MNFPMFSMKIIMHKKAKMFSRLLIATQQ